MKKTIFLVLILLSLLLVGCSTSNEATNKPVIELESNQLEINYIDDIKTKLFNNVIKIYDQEDGTYELDTYPEFNINVDNEDIYSGKLGTYEVTYRVKDADNHMTEKNITVLIKSNDATVSNPHSEVISFQDYNLTNDGLYYQLKSQYGLTVLLRQIDSELLNNYENQLNYDEINAQIEKDKQSQGEEDFVRMFKLAGMIDDDIVDYYKLQFLRKAVAWEKAYTEISTDEDLINENYSEYIENLDVCAIPLRFETEDEAQTTLNEFSDFTGDELLSKYTNKYNELGIEILPTDTSSWCTNVVITSEDKDEIGEDLYHQVYNNMSDGEFTTGVKSLDDYYYLIYRVKEEDTPSLEDVKEEIISSLIEDELTSDYQQEVLLDLRREHHIEILDQQFQNQYANADTEYQTVEETSRTIVARYEVNGETKEVSADDIYDILKIRYGISSVLNKINRMSLNTVTEIQLSEQKIVELEQQLNAIKTQYQNQYASYGITWTQYLNYAYSVNTEEELFDLIKSNQLIINYVNLENPVEDTDILNRYNDLVENEWNEIKASHILIQCDDSVMGACEEAYMKVVNIISTLIDTEESEVKNKFAELAQEWGEDGTANNGGDLGFFKSGDLVKPFEDAVVELNIGEYTKEPVKTKFGYHVILKTDEKPFATKPDGYDSMSEEEKLETEYGLLLKQIKRDIQSEQLTPEIIDDLLARLRNELGISFSNQDMENQYQVIQDVYIIN